MAGGKAVLYKKLFTERLARFVIEGRTVSSLNNNIDKFLDRPMSHEEIVGIWNDYFETLERNGGTDELHVYVHSPFCRSKCLYCNCLSRPLSPDDSLEKYVEVVSEEAELYGSLSRGYPVSSVYFGGGTVTLYSDDLFDTFLSGVMHAFRLKPDVMICCEMNPDSATEAKIESAVAHGVKRISFGVQTLATETLRRVNRGYQTLESVEKAIEAAYKAGINEVNTDLIAFLDGETPESLSESISALARMRPTNINLYRLMPIMTTKDVAQKDEMYPGFSWEKTADLFARTVSRFGYRVYGRLNSYDVAGRLLDAPDMHKGDFGIHSMNPRSVLGLGGWARSFVLNRASYGKPEIFTSLTDAKYFGRKTDNESEARYKIAQSCMMGTWIDSKEFTCFHGRSPRLFFPDRFRALEELGKFSEENDRIIWLFDGEQEAISAATLFYTDDESELLLNPPKGGFPNQGEQYSVFAVISKENLTGLMHLLGFFDTGENEGVSVQGAEWLMGDTIQLRLEYETKEYRIWFERNDGKPCFAASDFIKIIITAREYPAAIADWMTIFAIRLKGKTFETLASFFSGTCF